MPKYKYHTYSLTNMGHTFWLAESEQLKGCIGQGETEAEAAKELAENEKEWISTAKEMGIIIPAPMCA